MTFTLAHAATVQHSGYLAIIDEGQPAMQCATLLSDIYSAPDWDSLVYYAENYQLCECGGHWLF